jgi:hypothetical protein
MRALRVFSVLFTLAAASFVANAQTFNDLKVHIPYTVTVGSKSLLPGNYEILPVAGSAPGTLFGIYNDDRGAFEVLLSATPSESAPAEATELLLHTDGHEYTLESIRIQGNSEAYEFATSKSEAAHERESGTVKVNAETR